MGSEHSGMDSPDIPSEGHGNRSKRRRLKTSRYDAEFLDNEERMMLQQVNICILRSAGNTDTAGAVVGLLLTLPRCGVCMQALKISKLDTKRVEVDIPDAPVFYPTVEEFRDPMMYITK
jgi:hypothetical protein